jgi:2'-5' RNA ligase
VYRAYYDAREAFINTLKNKDMKKDTNSKTEKTIFEYLLVINPDLARQILVQQCKQEFKKNGFVNATVSPPHITIMNFLKHESREHLIVKKLRQLASGTTPFEIVLEDFGKFESSTSTVYVKVKTPEPILKIAERRKKEIRPLLKGMPKSNSKLPHVTIARGLTTEQLQKVWPKWSKETFEARFEAKEMILLKRPLGGQYKTLEKLPFKGENMNLYGQQNLFG